MTRITSLKWDWAGHIARITETIVNWRPPKTRPMGSDGQLDQADSENKLGTTGNGSFRMEGERGGLYPAEDINRLSRRKALVGTSDVFEKLASLVEPFRLCMP